MLARKLYLALSGKELLSEKTFWASYDALVQISKPPTPPPLKPPIPSKVRSTPFESSIVYPWQALITDKMIKQFMFIFFCIFLCSHDHYKSHDLKSHDNFGDIQNEN